MLHLKFIDRLFHFFITFFVKITKIVVSIYAGVIASIKSAVSMNGNSVFNCFNESFTQFIVGVKGIILPWSQLSLNRSLVSEPNIQSSKNWLSLFDCEYLRLKLTQFLRGKRSSLAKSTLHFNLVKTPYYPNQNDILIPVE